MAHLDYQARTRLRVRAGRGSSARHGLNSMVAAAASSHIVFLAVASVERRTHRDSSIIDSAVLLPSLTIGRRVKIKRCIVERETA